MIGVLIAAQAAAAAPDFAWLAGDWIHCGPGTSIEERWLGPARNGEMVGANLTQSRNGSSHEFFRIGPAREGAWGFHAQPGGAPPVTFAVAEHKNGRAVFEKLSHDFPQRVIYWRDGAKLRARIEGQVAGKLEFEEWVFSPAAGTVCPAGARRD